MKRLVPRRVRERLRHMIGAGEPARRLAASWAVGFAVAFSPVVGLHWVIAVVVAHLARLNKVDAVLGTLVINPWTMTVYFPSAVVLGQWLTGVRVPRVELPHPSQLFVLDFWLVQAEWLRPLLICWSVGATVFTVIVGFGSYLVLRRAIDRHRVRLAMKHVAGESVER